MSSSSAPANQIEDEGRARGGGGRTKGEYEYEEEEREAVKSIPLSAQKFQGLTEWRAGNLDHALKRVVHLQNNKHRARDR
jgi:hypothetical protein